jgi:hypothetical protein
LEVSPHPHMLGDRGTTRDMGLGIPTTDTTAGIAALDKDTGITTTAAAMLYRGTAGIDRHITVMAPVLGEERAALKIRGRKRPGVTPRSFHMRLPVARLSDGRTAEQFPSVGLAW